ncbi:septum site-determining protein MinC [Marinospirillum perlucidum]|uniref:septum site-determining protein MinC n=1 Tax=Marinospirillum perlucidum TaxID=1982602 RepID=UPI000DF3A5ED|nr:septum site-determining protein MinC [Marinospirillum perlucidum]
MADAAQPRLNLVTLPLKLRGTSLPATLLQPMTAQVPVLIKALEKRLQEGSALLGKAPLVIELGHLQEAFDLAGFQSECERLNIRLLAVRSSDPQQQTLAKQLGLMALNTQERPANAANQEELARTQVHEGTVRSGQQIIQDKGDLVILGGVNPGAEVLASGQIHIYGPLRGRALAGIHGDRQARIFTLQLAAELVAIAGSYQTNFNGDSQAGEGAVTIWLEKERLLYRQLTPAG